MHQDVHAVMLHCRPGHWFLVAPNNCGLQLINDITATSLRAYVCEMDNPAVSVTPTKSASVTASVSASASVTSTQSVTPSSSLLRSAQPAGSTLCAAGWYYFDDPQGEEAPVTGCTTVASCRAACLWCFTDACAHCVQVWRASPAATGTSQGP